MTETERSTKPKDINWNEYNYPPLLKLMHFRPSELPEDRRTLVLILFAIHLACLFNCLLNIIDNCIEGGLPILYAFLFFFIFNTLELFVFYRAYMGLCKDKSMLSLYTFIQPPVIILELLAAIADFLGFNGFVRVAALFKAGDTATAVIGLIISVGFVVIALISGVVYFKICQKKSTLIAALL